MAFRPEILNGTDFGIKVNGVLVACANSHSIEVTNSPREVACKDSGGWDNSEYGRFSWSASVDALVNLAADPNAAADDDKRNGYNELYDLMIGKTKVTIVAELDQDRAGTDVFTLTGTAIITSISKNAAHGDNVTFSVSFQGSGELVKVKTES